MIELNELIFRTEEPFSKKRILEYSDLEIYLRHQQDTYLYDFKFNDQLCRVIIKSKIPLDSPQRKKNDEIFLKIFNILHKKEILSENDISMLFKMKRNFVIVFCSYNKDNGFQQYFQYGPSQISHVKGQLSHIKYSRFSKEMKKEEADLLIKKEILFFKI